MGAPDCIGLRLRPCARCVYKKLDRGLGGEGNLSSAIGWDEKGVYFRIFTDRVRRLVFFLPALKNNLEEKGFWKLKYFEVCFFSKINRRRARVGFSRRVIWDF